MNFIVIIRGPLGVGKTTIAKKLATKLKADYISIDTVLEENSLDHADKDQGCIPLKNFLQANQIILPRLRQAVSNQTSVIIDGNFYHQAQIEDLVNHFPSNSYVFTLSAPLPTCIKRDLRRPNSYGKAAATAVYKLVSRFDYGLSIDTSTSSIQKISDIIISNLDN